MLPVAPGPVLLAVMDRLVPPVIDAAFVCTHPVAGLYGQILSLGNGGSAISWAIKTLGLTDGGVETETGPRDDVKQGHQLQEDADRGGGKQVLEANRHPDTEFELVAVVGLGLDELDAAANAIVERQLAGRHIPI